MEGKDTCPKTAVAKIEIKIIKDAVKVVDEDVVEVVEVSEIYTLLL